MASLGGSVARRYARALFDLGEARGTFEALGGELAQLAAVYEGSPDLRQALENPVFQLAQRRRVLESLLPRLAPSGDVQKFALLLLERRRLRLLPRIAQSYTDLVDAKLGRLRATVLSAKPLDPGTLGGVQRALEKRTGKKIVTTTAVDPALLGGVVARVGDLVFDGSLKSRLDGLRARVLN
jgi:F-type H+-transporting ATPase subunit delta